jgi:hypothetical protein
LRSLLKPMTTKPMTATMTTMTIRATSMEILLSMTWSR